MKITYDKEADAVYIRINSGKFSKNKKVDESTILDYDSKDNLLGIEILNASERMPKEALSSCDVKAI